MLRVSRAKAERAKSSGGRVKKKELAEEPGNPQERLPKNPLSADINKESALMAESLQKAAENNAVQADAIERLIKIIESQIHQTDTNLVPNGIKSVPHPVRLKVHRNERTALIEYIDVVPIEVKAVKH